MSDKHCPDLDYLRFRRYVPALPLSRYIDCYWFINSSCGSGAVFRELLHPDGAMGYIFNYGSALRFDEELLMNGAFLNGPYNQSMHLTMAGEINVVGIRFKPAGAHYFMAAPLNEFKNSFVSCSDMGLCNLNEYFCYENNDLKKVKKIDSVMLKLFNIEKQVSPFVLNALSIVNQSYGMLEINKLSSLLGVNQRKLERIFKFHIGISPVEYSRTVRIAHARRRLKDKTYEISDISFDLGFYDQAHFSKQFKSVVGLTPGEYRRRVQSRRAG
ncbi:Transcriptional regulator, AraC family [hydrothermal vent metagenome]|uniref:Transcriptional regulator, AraC family n=1 Tax=hydrothermal vent metagenome TaxID=652676 RepID=A0A3B0XI22_9ZZZZ